MNSDIEYTPPNAKVTGNDVEKVRKYVNTGLSLPTTLAEINEQYRGSVSEDGISALALLATFEKIKNHAAQWSPLETCIIKVATALKRFAEDLEEYAKPAINEIKDMDGYKSYELKTIDLTEEQIQMFKSPLDESSTKTINTYSTIDGYIEAVVESINNKKSEATEIKNKIVLFESDLNDIEVDIGKKVAKAMASKTLQELRDITAKLVVISNQAHDLRKESKYSVGEWLLFSTLVFPVVGVPLCAGYFSSRDNNYSARLEKLNSDEAHLLLRQAELQKIAAILNSIQSSMRSLSIFTRGAIDGLMQIETLWTTTLKEVTASRNLLSKTKDFSELTIFIIKMTAVLNRWEKIKNYMTDMTMAFSQRN